jgi:regulator of protease activity HflC (stomatin/prohibitin superfamily)
VPAVESVLLALLAILGFFVVVAAVRSVRVVQQFETGIVFRLGRIQSSVRGPGLHLIVPVIDRMQKVNMQIITMGVPAQDGITRDNVTVRVDAVVYFRVIDPIKAVVNVQNYLFAVSQVAQTSLRSVIGQSELDQLLSDRDALNAQLKAVIDEPTEAPWGIRIERVEIKDVALPEGMKRSMSRQAEAERERRARIITADGEFQASKRLAAAAREMSADPSALQLRMLQTVVEVAAEKNSTLVMPLPVELLRFFDRMAPAAEAPAAKQAPAEAEEPEPVEEALQVLPAIDPPADLPEVPLAGRSRAGQPVGAGGQGVAGESRTEGAVGMSTGEHDEG